MPWKSKHYFLNGRLWFSQFFFFSNLFVNKILKNFSASYMKLLSSCENLSSNPLQMLCSGDFDHENAFRKYRIIPGKLPLGNGHWRRIDQWKRGKPVQKLWLRLPKEFLEWVSVIKEENRNFIFIFLLNKEAKNFEFHLRNVQKVLI